MSTNKQHNDDTDRMMSEEYGREFGGCLCALVAAFCVFVIITVAAIIKIFT